MQPMHGLMSGTKRVDRFYIALILTFSTLSCLFVVFTICPGCGPNLGLLARLVRFFGGEPELRYAPVTRVAAGNISILPLGDSITMGYWSSGPYNGYRLRLLNSLTGTEPYWSTNQTINESALFQRVTCIGTEHHGNFTQNAHFGWGGHRIGEIQAKFRNAVQNFHSAPDVVLLMAGINDIDQDFHRDTAPARLGNLIDDVYWRFPRTVVIVAQLTPVKHNVTVRRWKDEFNEQILDVVKTRRDAEWKILSVNMSAALDPSDLVDELHPIDPGYAKIATVWVKGLAEAKDLGWFNWSTDP